MLFAAVQYLLLSGLDHPLAGHYPIIAARPAWQFAMEGWSPQLSVTRYRDGIGETEILADVSAHGWWIDWRLEKAWPDQ